MSNDGCGIAPSCCIKEKAKIWCHTEMWCSTSECLYCGFTMVSHHVKEDGYTIRHLECQCRQVHDF